MTIPEKQDLSPKPNDPPYPSLEKEIFPSTDQSIKSLEKNAGSYYPDAALELIYRYYSAGKASPDHALRAQYLCRKVLELPLGNHGGIEVTKKHHAVASYVQGTHCNWRYMRGMDGCSQEDAIKLMCEAAPYSNKVAMAIYDIYKSSKDVPYADIKAWALCTFAALQKDSVAKTVLKTFFKEHAFDISERSRTLRGGRKFIAKDQVWLYQLVASFCFGIEKVKDALPQQAGFHATDRDPDRKIGWASFDAQRLITAAIQKNPFGSYKFIAFSYKHGLMTDIDVVTRRLNEIEVKAKNDSNTALRDRVSFLEFKIYLLEGDYNSAKEAFSNMSLAVIHRKEELILNLIEKDPKPDGAHGKALHEVVRKKLMASHVTVVSGLYTRNRKVLESGNEHEVRSEVIAHLKEAYAIYESTTDKQNLGEATIIELFNYMLKVGEKDFTEPALAIIEKDDSLKRHFVLFQLPRQEEPHSEEDISEAFKAFKQKYRRHDQLESFKPLLYKAIKEKFYEKDDWFLKLVEQHDLTNPEYNDPELHQLLSEDVFKLLVRGDQDNPVEIKEGDLGEDNYFQGEQAKEMAERINLVLDIFAVISGDEKHQFAETKQILKLAVYNVRDSALNEKALAIILEGKMEGPFVYRADRETYKDKYTDFAYKIRVRHIINALFAELNAYIDERTQHPKAHQLYSDVLPFFKGVKTRTAFRDGFCAKVDFSKLNNTDTDGAEYTVKEIKTLAKNIISYLDTEGSKFKRGFVTHRLPDLINDYKDKLQGLSNSRASLVRPPVSNAM